MEAAAKRMVGVFLLELLRLSCYTGGGEKGVGKRPEVWVLGECLEEGTDVAVDAPNGGGVSLWEGIGPGGICRGIEHGTEDLLRSHE